MPHKNTFLDALRAIDVDIDGTLARFMDNAALLEKFLRRYPKDELMPPVLKAFGESDCEALGKALHKMKGTSVNLGINNIAEQCEHISNMIKQKNNADLNPLIEKLHADYNEVVNVIKNTA